MPVSVLFNEPKLLKSCGAFRCAAGGRRFSALQRAEIAEMIIDFILRPPYTGFSALQRAEIAEIRTVVRSTIDGCGFSALQRAEIAEIHSSK